MTSDDLKELNSVEYRKTVIELTNKKYIEKFGNDNVPKIIITNYVCSEKPLDLNQSMMMRFNFLEDAFLTYFTGWLKGFITYSLRSKVNKVPYGEMLRDEYGHIYKLVQVYSDGNHFIVNYKINSIFCLTVEFEIATT